jgi:hypothetical protein
VVGTSMTVGAGAGAALAGEGAGRDAFFFGATTAIFGSAGPLFADGSASAVWRSATAHGSEPHARVPFRTGIPMKGG